MKRQIRTYAQATEPAGEELVAQIGAHADRLNARLASIRNTIVIASGKGGVGKSFVAAGVAGALVTRGLSVGALDADVNGPSLARMLGASHAPLRVEEHGVHPAQTRAGCTVMSTDLLLESPDTPLRWREPAAGAFVWQSALETGMLREFLSDVHWGDLDALVIDLPPGTDKIARILPLLTRITAILVVTTPSTVANAAVSRSLTQLRDAGVPNVRVICNMDGYVCPHCRSLSPLFGPQSVSPLYDPHASEARAGDNTGTWASIPFDPGATAAIDAGIALPADSPVAIAIDDIVDRLQILLMPAPETQP